jgi:hypothetical protein
LENDVPSSAHESVPSEWNDSLTGEYLWTKENFGEAVSELITPLTWSLLWRFRQEWSDIQGIPVFGNLGGIYILPSMITPHCSKDGLNIANR